jgi:hypothetical protein
LANRGRASGKKAPCCEDCYFRKNMLCALDLDEPCATFRPDRPEGLVPPRQPVLLMRTPRWVASGRLAPGSGTATLASGGEDAPVGGPPLQYGQ